MRTSKLCCIIMLIITTSTIHAQEINVDQTFTSDTVFNPFNGEHSLYSFKMSAEINLLSDSSLVRVILEGSHGEIHLIYETYPMIADSNIIICDNSCDETCYLDNIDPYLIKIEIIDAIIHVYRFVFETNPIENIEELRTVKKKENDSAKVTRINLNISKVGLYWRADVPTSSFYFIELEKKYGYKYNNFGFEYFKGGIFEPYAQNYPLTNSNYVPEFSWRDRHGANSPASNYFDGDNQGYTGWLSNFEDQGSTSSCWAFSAVGTVESYSNLWFNLHGDANNPYQLDPDLSELEAVKCNSSISPPPTPPPPLCNTPGWPTYVYPYFTSNGIDNEAGCTEFSCTHLDNSSIMCGNICPLSSYRIKMSGFNFVFYSLGEDYIKEALITKGPLSACLVSPNHAMVLFGFKTNRVGDIVYHGSGSNDPDIIIEAGSRLNGTTQWLFKDSDIHCTGPDFWIYPGITCAVTNFSQVTSIDGVIFQYLNNTPPPVIKCTDEDHDGYYWWGISPLNLNCNCPQGVKAEEEDCNDNDASVKYYGADYSCLPIDCSTSTVPMVISATPPPWNTDRHVNQDVIIDHGVTLTITAQVFFTPGAKIIVKPGGRLNLFGQLIGGIQYEAKLSSSCADPWVGVELWGNPDLSQEYNSPYFINQGFIYIDHGIIENSICGIKTFIPGWLPDGPVGNIVLPFYNGLPTGGVVQATKATFRNNIIGVEFYPYKQKDNYGNAIDNASYFNKCLFTANNNCLNNYSLQYSLKFDGNNRIPIKGCIFENQQTDISSNRGTGLYSINSIIDIDKYNQYETSFSKYKYGIYGIHTGSSTASVLVKNTTFSDNDIGSYYTGYTGVNPLSVLNNYFSSYMDWSNIVLKYGLYLNNCTGYKVQQNTFIKLGNLNGISVIGTIVNNSGPVTNYIYDNTFSNLSIGIEGLNDNLPTNNVDGQGIPLQSVGTGLHFVCNNFENMNLSSQSKIFVTQDNTSIGTGIGYYQQNMGNVPPYQKPAGNNFSVNETSYDLNMDANVHDIQYLYHQFCPTGVRTEPKNILNANKVHKSYLLNSTYYRKTNNTPSCPDNFPLLDKIEIRNNLTAAQEKVDSLILILKSLIDGGSTDNLLTAVNYSTPYQADSIYQDLITPSPYLSDTVVKTSIQKEEVLSNDLIKNIMVANPQSAKNDDLIEELSNRSVPMPDSMLLEILNGKDTVGELEVLKSTLVAWVQARDMYYKSLVDFYLSDTSDSSSGDSLRILLSNTSRLYAKYMLFSYYCDLNNFDGALEVLDSIPTHFHLDIEDQNTYDRLLTLLPLLKGFLNDSCGYNMPDSLQILSLNDLASSDYDLPGSLARNILTVCGLINYEEPIVTETSLKFMIQTKPVIFSKKSDFTVFPNPCKNYVITKCLKNIIFTVDLIDESGKKISSFNSGETNQLIVPFQNLSSGNYFLRINVDGIQKEVKKIIHLN